MPQIFTLGEAGGPGHAARAARRALDRARACPNGSGRRSGAPAFGRAGRSGTELGRLPSVDADGLLFVAAVAVRALDARSMTVSPGFFAPTAFARSSELVTGLPSTETMMSPPTATWPFSVVVLTVPPWMPALSAARALLHALHERAALDRQVQRRQRAVDRQRGQAEVGAADGAALLELGDLGLGGVDRDREADADAAAAAAAGLDLGVDADHPAGRVEQRAARVARVDRRVGLQDVVDREAVGRRDLALQRGDHAGRQRAFEVERVADRVHRVADLSGARVAERERVQRQRRRGGCAARRGRSRGPCRPPALRRSCLFRS